MRRLLWVAPVLALAALVFAGTWVRSHIESAIQDQTESELTTLLRADIEALRLWMRLQQDNATIIANDAEVRHDVQQLVEFAADGNTTTAALLGSPVQQEIIAELKPWIDRQAYNGFVLFNTQGRILAAEQVALVGLDTVIAGQQKFITDVLSGKASVSHPFPSRIPMPNEQGEMITGIPVMFVAAPVLGDDGKPMAVIALRIDPSKEFTDILTVAQPGTTGETYAFDERGFFLSQSRFEDQLRKIALMTDQRDSRSVLKVELRNPGVDMTTGLRPEKPRQEQPLTAMAEGAIRDKPPHDDPGVNVTGYRDYRGVDTVGAWAWLPEYDLGIATEMDKAEAFHPMFVLRGFFWTLFGLLALAAALLLGMALLARRFERRMQQAVVAAGQLGQYALEEKIGEGGMGSVYRARHAMLRRPTAVKLLEPAKTTDVSVARFEREVQLTSQLNHPNTITIYDYGRTDEGVFYYAMEFLDGFSLDVLVQRFGPQPDGRVIPILLQVCGSLIEAHTAGLIHRDIKPANIMLTRRGGVCDFVKLLDFGLVKAIDSRKMQTLTAADSITGTPLYMAPETIQDAEGCDARGDLYCAGGRGLFPADRPAGVRFGQRDGDHAGARRVASDRSQQATGPADVARAGAVAAGVPGKASGRSTADRGRDGPRFGVVRRGEAVDGGRCRVVVAAISADPGGRSSNHGDAGAGARHHGGLLGGEADKVSRSLTSGGRIRRAKRTSSTSFLSFSFSKTRARCLAVVCTLMPRAVAICFCDIPATIMSITSPSRGVSLSRSKRPWSTGATMIEMRIMRSASWSS